MLTARIAVALCVASLLIAHSSRFPTGLAFHTTADKWVDSVVDVLADPKLYQYTKRSLPLRLKRLVAMHVVPSSLGDEIMQGENPALGISSASASFINDGFESIGFCLPPADTKGRQLLPILRRKLQKRLRPPVWLEGEESEDEVSGKHILWVQAETGNLVQLSLNPPYADKSGASPCIWVSAGTDRSFEE